MARECYRIEALPSGDLLAYTETNPVSTFTEKIALEGAWKPDGAPLVPHGSMAERKAAREALPAWAAHEIPPSGKEARAARKARAEWHVADLERARATYFAAEMRAMDALCAALVKAGAQCARGNGGLALVTAEGVTFRVKVAPAEGEG